MLFNSFAFLLFFPAVVVVFFLLPHRFRWAFLLLASYYFYMSWEALYGFLILTTTLVSYFSALGISRTVDTRLRSLYLFGGIATGIGILLYFKYTNFFLSSIEPVIQSFTPTFSSPTLDILLPIGISFYTFQSLSYLIDIYRNKSPVEKHFGIFALYVSFFPQLVAGPIETSTRLLPQFYKKMSPEPSRIVSGLRLTLWGFFKKVVIADNVAIIVDTVYSDPAGVNGIALAAGTFFFAIQIYADFSGYSDIARGTARMMGYDLMLNFNRPYFSKSIAEFWRRWHISLMHWFREYIYFPLGGSRVKAQKWIRNILIIFLISGIWHGANWTFIVWGLLNAAYIIIGRYTEDLRSALANGIGLTKLPTLLGALQIGATFSLTLFAWIFFRAASLSEALLIIQKIAFDLRQIVLEPQGALSLILEAGFSLGVDKEKLTVFLVAIALLLVVEVAEEKGILRKQFTRLPRIARWGLYYAMVLIIIFAGNFGDEAFLYFQF